MMTFGRIFPHATLCLAGDHIVLLDIRQDRYFLVPPGIGPAARSWLSSADGTAAPPALAAMLQSNKVHRPGDPVAGLERRDLIVPLTLEKELRRRTLGLAGTVRVQACLVATWLALRTFPLQHHLARFAGYGARDTAADRDRLQDALDGFERARRQIPIARNCLLDSLALGRWLSAEGFGCRIVFGVTATPFAAHCWLQDEEAILNDHFDRISRFTPIFSA